MTLATDIPQVMQLLWVLTVTLQYYNWLTGILIYACSVHVVYTTMHCEVLPCAYTYLQLWFQAFTRSNFDGLWCVKVSGGDFITWGKIKLISCFMDMAVGTLQQMVSVFSWAQAWNSCECTQEVTSTILIANMETFIDHMETQSKCLQPAKNVLVTSSSLSI